MIPTQKRREQTRRAQRGYRQRQEDALISLRIEVNELQGTIEGLNACFLSLADTLTSSQFLKEDKIAVDELRKAMKTFLELNRSCDGVTEDGEMSDSDDTSLKHSKVVGLNLPNSVNQTQSESNRPNSETDSLAPASSQMMSNSASQPHTISLPSPLRNFSPAHVLSFAARLQQTAYKSGLYLASNSETYNHFCRVFNYTLNFQTHQSLFMFLSRVVNENFERLLEPPEVNSPPAESRSQLKGWLNATEVSHYFSHRGFDFNKSSLYVQIEIDEGYSSPNTMGFSWPFLPWFQPASQQAGTITRSQSTKPYSSSACAKRKVVVDVVKLINSEPRH